MLARGYEITQDPAQIDVAAAHDFLRTAYWCKDIPIETLRRGIENSFCIAVRHGGEQVGFARLVTDYATFSYVSDVYVLKQHEGKGLARAMLSYFQDHPKLQGQRVWFLFTRDAHDVYAKLGWTPLAHPERGMIRLDEKSYI